MVCWEDLEKKRLNKIQNEESKLSLEEFAVFPMESDLLAEHNQINGNFFERNHSTATLWSGSKVPKNTLIDGYAFMYPKKVRFGSVVETML